MYSGPFYVVLARYTLEVTPTHLSLSHLFLPASVELSPKNNAGSNFQ